MTQATFQGAQAILSEEGHAAMTRFLDRLLNPKTDHADSDSEEAEAAANRKAWAATLASAGAA